MIATGKPAFHYIERVTLIDGMLWRHLYEVGFAGLYSPILRSLPLAFKVNLCMDRVGHWLEDALVHCLVRESNSSP